MARSRAISRRSYAPARCLRPLRTAYRRRPPRLSARFRASTRSRRKCNKLSRTRSETERDGHSSRSSPGRRWRVSARSSCRTSVTQIKSPAPYLETCRMKRTRSSRRRTLLLHSISIACVVLMAEVLTSYDWGCRYFMESPCSSHSFAIASTFRRLYNIALEP